MARLKKLRDLSSAHDRLTVGVARTLVVAAETQPRPPLIDLPSWRFVTTGRATQENAVVLEVQQRVVTVKPAHCLPQRSKRPGDDAAPAVVFSPGYR
jgi:hypothetical protein